MDLRSLGFYTDDDGYNSFLYATWMLFESVVSVLLEEVVEEYQGRGVPIR